MNASLTFRRLNWKWSVPSWLSLRYSPLSSIRQYLINGRGPAGFGNATWNGAGGITSSYANANGNGSNLAIGYANNADLAAVNLNAARLQNYASDPHYGTIAVEDLNIRGLASGMLAKSVNDAGWLGFISKLAYKAAEAGRKLIQVDPRGTSQACLCGAEVRKTLSQRWHQCPDCGLSAARDHVSAQLILGLGLSLLGVT